MLVTAKIDSSLNTTLDAIANILAAHDVFVESVDPSKGKQRFKNAFINHVMNGETESFEIIYRSKGVRLIIPFIVENDIVTLVEIQVYDRPIKNLATTRMALATELANVVGG